MDHQDAVEAKGVMADMEPFQAEGLGALVDLYIIRKLRIVPLRL